MEYQKQIHPVCAFLLDGNPESAMTAILSGTSVNGTHMVIIKKEGEEKEVTYTPLILSVIGGYKDVMRELLARGADVNAIGIRREIFRYQGCPFMGVASCEISALTAAIERRDLETITLLVSAGADLSRRYHRQYSGTDMGGGTHLEEDLSVSDLAIEAGDKTILSFLNKHSNC